MDSAIGVRHLRYSVGFGAATLRTGEIRTRKLQDGEESGFPL